MDTVIEIGYRSIVSRPGRSTRRACFESTSEASETPEPVINAKSQVPARPSQARPKSDMMALLARPPAARMSAERKVAQQAGLVRSEIERHGPVRPQSARAGLVGSEIERHGPARPQSARAATRPAPSAARRPQSAPRKPASKSTQAEERPRRVKIDAAEAKRLLQYLEGDEFKKAWALGLLVDEPAVTGHELEEQTPLQKFDPRGIFRGSELRSVMRKKVVAPSSVETKDSPYAHNADGMVLVQDMTAPSKRPAQTPYKVKRYSRGRGLGGLQPFNSESRVGGSPQAITMKSVVLRTASGPFGVVTGLCP